ncbi:MAG: ATP-dependent helicase UvrD/PcrA [Campylobacterota bacterium]|nr:ATP-dependent helicase UvrD/PcrA [Campylobacterota bacterium]
MPLSRLNEEQYAAAVSTYKQNLIIASAGTGKTSTIVGRIAHLLKSGVEPHEILLLTFTNKAAAEMIQRVADFFGKDIASKIDAGTFHAVSYRWLKKENKKVVLKQQRELKTLFRSVYEKRTFGHLGAEIAPYGGNYLYDVYSFYQNTELVNNFEEWIKNKYPEHTPFSMIYADIVDEFEELKKEYGFLNFNDLLLKFRKMCKDRELGYKEVLVDEYQDTNALQGTLIDAMNPPSLFCVGDYDQSIYAFNGADISIIGTFSKKFPNAKVHTLTKNYRSTVPILSLASKVIEHNERIYPKKLEVTRIYEAQSPKLLAYDELFDQYHDIAFRIQNTKTPKDEIAVIFRNNSSADGIEVGLRELGINCKRKGGTIGSAMAKEIYIALKTLGDGRIFYGLYAPDESITNPFPKKKQNHQLGLFDDLLELGSVAKFLKLGFEDKFIKNPILKHPKLTKESATFLYDFYLLYRDLKGVKDPKTVVKKIALSAIFKNISEVLATKRATLKDGSIDERQKADSLSKIERKMILLEELSKPYSEHDRFLNAMILGSSDLTQGEGVNLLSVHASKGLEYKEVYIVDLMDGRFPNRKLMQRGGSLDEERRLFYVAVTRAKDILYLSYAKYDKIKKINFLPSQFLYEAGLVAKDEAYRAMVLKEMDEEDDEDIDLL